MEFGVGQPNRVLCHRGVDFGAPHGLSAHAQAFNRGPPTRLEVGQTSVQPNLLASSRRARRHNGHAPHEARLPSSASCLQPPPRALCARKHAPIGVRGPRTYIRPSSPCPRPSRSADPTYSCASRRKATCGEGRATQEGAGAALLKVCLLGGEARKFGA